LPPQISRGESRALVFSKLQPVLELWGVFFGVKPVLECRFCGAPEQSPPKICSLLRRRKKVGKTLILDRFQDKVLSLGDPTAATLEPDSASHEHHAAFFPDTGLGTAHSAGFGWRGGSGV
jgi:hypothetical protein